MKKYEKIDRLIDEVMKSSAKYMKRCRNKDKKEGNDKVIRYKQMNN